MGKRKMTPKELVLKQYQRATRQVFLWMDDRTVYGVFRDSRNIGPIGIGNSPRQAWQAAARNLK